VVIGGMETYLTTCGAITLHGPHQVAKQSRTRSVSLSSSRALSNSAFLHPKNWISTNPIPITTIHRRRDDLTHVCKLCTPSFPILPVL
jgi:hypothetical protein